MVPDKNVYNLNLFMKEHQTSDKLKSKTTSLHSPKMTMSWNRLKDIRQLNATYDLTGSIQGFLCNKGHYEDNFKHLEKVWRSDNGVNANFIILIIILWLCKSMSCF